MGPCCHTGIVFLSSWLPHESVVSSAFADQLLILLPAWRAGPSPIPLPWVDPISLRVHAFPRSLVSYSNNWVQSCILENPKAYQVKPNLTFLQVQYYKF
jgi:hypothetical protein